MYAGIIWGVASSESRELGSETLATVAHPLPTGRREGLAISLALVSVSSTVMRVRGPLGAFVAEVFDSARVEKACTSCGAVLPLGEFPKHRGKRDGLASRCKACQRAASARFRVERPEVVRRGKAAERERYRRLNADGVVRVVEKWCPQCGRVLPAGSFHRMAQQADGLASKCRECRARWVGEHLSLFVDYSHRRRARERGVEWEPIDRGVLYEREGGRCHICGRRVAVDVFEVEHLVPLSRGGSHTWSNVGIAHPRCNRVKWANDEVVQLRLG